MTTKYRFGAFKLDLDRGSLTEDGREVPLRPKTFHVLRHLVLQHGTLVSKDDLIAAVWTDTAVTDNSLSQCLFEIRRALGDEAQTIIRTVARRGYVFDASIEPEEHGDGASRLLPISVESRADVGSEPDLAATTASLVERWRLRQALAAGLALAIGLSTLAALRTRRGSAPADEGPVQLTNFTDSVVSPSLSRDGRLLAFVRGGSFGTVGAPRGQVYVKQLPSGEPVQLTNDPTSK